MRPMADQKNTPALPCPECRERGGKGAQRIGNQRTKCSTCNNFAQNVLRHTASRLKVRHQAEYDQIKMEVTFDLYPQVIETYAREAGLT